MKDVREDIRASRAWEINTCVEKLNDTCTGKVSPLIKRN